MSSLAPPSTPASPPLSVLAAIDYSEIASAVVQRAIETAKQSGAQELHFLHVNQGDPSEAAQELRRAHLIHWLEARLIGANTMPDGVRFVAHEATGEPARVIVEMANDLRADTVIVGAHQRSGRERAPAGSVAQAVARDCGCAVFVVRPTVHHRSLEHLDLPCPDCQEVRERTDGDSLWCAAHHEKHGRCHLRFNPHALASTTHRMLS